MAFLGADTDDAAANARAFLRTHPVSYPSYATTDTSILQLLKGGLIGRDNRLHRRQWQGHQRAHRPVQVAGTLEQDIGDIAPPAGASN